MPVIYPMRPRAGGGVRLRLAAAFVLAALAAAPLPALADRTAPVLGGAVILGVPDGYCIDRAASREGQNSAVILMGRCSSTSAPQPALITVTIGAAGSASVLRGGGQSLAAFFTSDRGKRMLSRSGRAEDVRILRALDRDNGFFLYISDRGIGSYWRAVTGVKARLVTVSATGAPGRVLAPETGRALVEDVVRMVRKANPPKG